MGEVDKNHGILLRETDDFSCFVCCINKLAVTNHLFDPLKLKYITYDHCISSLCDLPFPIGITRYTFSVFGNNIQKCLEYWVCDGFRKYFDSMSRYLPSFQTPPATKPGEPTFFSQHTHGASLKTKTGLRQLFIANCRNRATAFKTLCKPGCLFKE